MAESHRRWLVLWDDFDTECFDAVPDYPLVEDYDTPDALAELKDLLQSGIRTRRMVPAEWAGIQVWRAELVLTVEEAPFPDEEGFFSCIVEHGSVQLEDPQWRETSTACMGQAQMFANSCKLPKRAELAGLVRQAPTNPDVFCWRHEFKDHHTRDQADGPAGHRAVDCRRA